MTKRLLILKATKDICGNELGLISHNCQLLGFDVVIRKITSEKGLTGLIRRLSKKERTFDYIYLCTHGNASGFDVDLGKKAIAITWSKFSELICENGILSPDSILLLACCKGGLFQVATDILAVCYKINFVCGVKWNVHPWDLTTGFVVFIHNIENKQAEPSYAARKASLATDYTFVCYDRDEIEISQQYQIRRETLFYSLGWTSPEGRWIEKSKKIKENAGVP